MALPPKPIVLAPNWAKNLKFTALLYQHKHDLPLCRPGHHDDSCEGFGREATCIKVVKGFDPNKNKFVFGALCTHFR